MTSALAIHLYLFFVAWLCIGLAVTAGMVMSMPGGLPPPRPDQGYSPTGSPMAPGSSAVVRARQVIVSGPGEGVYSYSPSAGPGNLVGSAGISQAGTDDFTNMTLAGNSAYGPGYAVSEQAGAILFYTGSLSGGWTFQGQFLISTGAPGTLLVDFTDVQLSGTMEASGLLTANAGLTVAGNISAANSTIDVHNGNVNLNMAQPPNYAAVIAGTATAAQVEACLGGLLQSMTNRQLIA